MITIFYKLLPAMIKSLPTTCYHQWKCTFLIILFSGPMLLLNQKAFSMPLSSLADFFQSEQTVVTAPFPAHAQSKNRDMTKGIWYSRATKSRYCIQFRESDQAWGWNMGRCFDKTLFENKQAGIFQLRRESGTLTLTGRLDEDESEGKYEFVEDSAFRKYLTDNNITSRDANLTFFLFLENIDKNYIAFLKKNYTSINGDRLQELAIHGVSQKDYQTYITLFEKYSNKMPSMQEVIEASIHGIDQEYIEQIQASGYTNLSMRKMIETKIHGIDAAFIETLRKQGFTDLSIDRVLAAKIHGISPAYIKQIEALGYTGLSLDKLIEAKIHGINSSYIKDLETAGFTKLPLNQVIEAKIHGVNADFIAEARSKGYQSENIRQYVELKIHGFNRSAKRE